jgi:hypothetical protein
VWFEDGTQNGPFPLDTLNGFGLTEWEWVLLVEAIQHPGKVVEFGNAATANA